MLFILYLSLKFNLLNFIFSEKIKLVWGTQASTCNIIHLAYLIDLSNQYKKRERKKKKALRALLEMKFRGYLLCLKNSSA